MKARLLVLLMLICASCVTPAKLNNATVIGAGSQSCFKKRSKNYKAKGVRTRLRNPTMRIKF